MAGETETEQLTLTVRKETLEDLRELYPHFLKDQQRLLAAVTEVQMRRDDVAALQLQDPRIGTVDDSDPDDEDREQADD